MRLVYWLVLFIPMCISSLWADDLQELNSVLLSDQVFYGDYYVLNDVVEISGTIKGNAYLVGTQVSIDGVIEGNVFVLAGNLDFSGEIKGDLWALAGGMSMGGTLLQDAVLLSANIDLLKSGWIGGNVTLFSGNADMEGWVEGNATVLSSHLKVVGGVGHNLRSFVGKLRVLTGAKILGDLRYKSNEDAEISQAAQIGGKVIYQRSFFKEIMDVPFLKGLIIGSKVAAFLMNFIYTFVIGWIVIRIFPRKLHKALVALEENPMKSFLHGLILLILFPLASLVLLVTVIGAPFALTLIALNIVTFYTAKIFTILWMGNAVFSHWKWKKNGMGTFVCAQLIYCTLVAVPFLGPFLAFLAMVFGLGAIAVAQKA